jgi:hypothetical protein
VNKSQTNKNMDHPSKKNSNCLDQYILEGIREIVGQDDFAQLLKRFPLKPNGTLWNENLAPYLEELYGKRGGQGIALRAGRAAFRYAFRKSGGELGLTTTDVRFLPVPLKIKTTLNAFAGWIAGPDCGSIEVSETDQSWGWKSSGYEENAADAHFALGFLQELASWASRGKTYRVVEQKLPPGNESTRSFLIEKKPIE